MKDLLRQPIFYYIAVPALLTLWPLLIWFVYLPSTADTWQRDSQLYTESREYAEQILTLDPERRNYGDNKKAQGFDYTVAIDAAARKQGIASTNYTISSKPITGTRTRQTQDCQIIINDIDITKLARFISGLQLTWSGLQCQKLTLTKKQGLPDSWKVDLTLRYYY